LLRFGDHTFDPDTGELDGPRESVRLQPKPARLLAMLLAAGGDLVEREQIRAALWPDTTVDFDAGLNTCVRQIRTALQQTGGSAELVETLPKRGYRVAVPVAPDDAPAHQPAAGTADSEPPGPVQWLPYALFFVLLAVASGTVLWGEMFGYPGNLASLAPTQRAVRLAVLPFRDPDVPEPSTLNRELAEAFLTALVEAAPREIVVVGPGTTASHATAGAGLPEIATAVDADFVLHGGHRAATGAFFVEVVTSDGGHLYARRFEELSGTPAEIAAIIVPEMTASILQADR